MLFGLTLMGRGWLEADDMDGRVYAGEDHVHTNPEPQVGQLRASEDEKSIHFFCP